MNEEAIRRVETLDRELGLQSQFSRVPHATWTSTKAVVPIVQKEADLCKEIGLPCEYLTPEQATTDLPESIKPLAALRFNQQAIFNPITYCRGLVVSQTAHTKPLRGSRIRLWLPCGRLAPALVSVCIDCRPPSRSFPVALCLSARA